MQSIIDYWKRCVDFKGVTTRKDYWIPTIIIMVIIVVLNLVTDPNAPGWSPVDIFVLVLVLPSISLSIRRLHDQNKSGWFWLINLVPGIGSIIVFVLMCMGPNYGGNKWFEADKIHSDLKDVVGV